eukprot:3325759-Rhodomonas_salina.1
MLEQVIEELSSELSALEESLSLCRRHAEATNLKRASASASDSEPPGRAASASEIAEIAADASSVSKGGASSHIQSEEPLRNGASSHHPPTVAGEEARAWADQGVQTETSLGEGGEISRAPEPPPRLSLNLNPPPESQTPRLG